MKGITRITRRLMSLFLVLVVSSMMFLSSPAVAATSSVTLLTPDNFETEVENSDKPVIVILASQVYLEENPNYLEETKSKAVKFFGDKYKIVTGKIEENGFVYSNVLAPRIYPPFPGIVGYKNGALTRGIYLTPNDPTQGFEFVKEQLG